MGTQAGRHRPAAPPTGDRAWFDVPEDRALRLGLAFRLLAPMRNAAFVRACVTEAMGGEEAAYWLGMATHRRYPRRVCRPARSPG